MRHATHTFTRRLGALLLCLALLAGLLPMSALAAETEGVIYNVKYIDENGEERSCKAATVVTSGTTTGGGDEPDKVYWYVVKDIVNITAPITVKGDVRLILAGGLHAIGGGIDVSAGNSLTIYSQAGSSDYVDVTNTGGVAIGSTEGCGTIAIHGGKVKGGGEVGIGGPGGRVTITGGSVTASQSNSAICGDHVHINGDAVVIAKSGTIDEGTADRKD